MLKAIAQYGLSFFIFKEKVQKSQNCINIHYCCIFMQKQFYSILLNICEFYFKLKAFLNRLLTVFIIDTSEMRNQGFQVVKPLVLGCETLGFTTRNQCFQTVKRCLSQSTSVLHIYAFPAAPLFRVNIIHQKGYIL